VFVVRDVAFNVSCRVSMSLVGFVSKKASGTSCLFREAHRCRVTVIEGKDLFIKESLAKRILASGNRGPGLKGLLILTVDVLRFPRLNVALP